MAETEAELYLWAGRVEEALGSDGGVSCGEVKALAAAEFGPENARVAPRRRRVDRARVQRLFF